MKKSSVLMIAVAAAFTSCGTFAQLSSVEGQQFHDGIYANSPDIMSRAEREERKAETDALVAQTKESPIYLFGDRKDTVMIPDNCSATIRYDKQLSTTVVTVQENPYDWRNNLSPWSYYSYYSPIRVGFSWSWGSHWGPHWSVGISSPWYWSGWYDPWYWGRWYDPWYYSGWYDPFYWGGWYPYHHYHGCWDPYWGHHHSHHWPIYAPGHGPGYGGRDRWYGPRISTEAGRGSSGRQVASSSGNRGLGTSGTTRRVLDGRNTSGGDRLISSERAVTTRRAVSTSASSSAGRVTGTSPMAGKVQQATGRVPSVAGNVQSASGRVPSVTGKVQQATGRVPSVAGNVQQATGRVPSVAGTSDRKPSQTTGKVQASGKPLNYRKPSVPSSSSSSGAAVSSGSYSDRRSSYERSSSSGSSYSGSGSYGRSSSDSYRRSSPSPSRSSGFSSGGGSGRSSSGSRSMSGRR